MDYISLDAIFYCWGSTLGLVTGVFDSSLFPTMLGAFAGGIGSYYLQVYHEKQKEKRSEHIYCNKIRTTIAIQLNEAVRTAESIANLALALERKLGDIETLKHIEIDCLNAYKLSMQNPELLTKMLESQNLYSSISSLVISIKECFSKRDSITYMKNSISLFICTLEFIDHTQTVTEQLAEYSAQFGNFAQSIAIDKDEMESVHKKLLEGINIFQHAIEENGCKNL